MAGRKLCNDTLYALELGIEHKVRGKRMVKRLGGAKKLRSMSPEARALLLSTSKVWIKAIQERNV